jgi:DNA-directed RNA polymerase specialized sigma24 family protein
VTLCLRSPASNHSPEETPTDEAPTIDPAPAVRGRLRNANPAKGKFRAFLLVAWKRFLIDEFRRRQTLRRGGDVKLLSLDFRTGEQRWQELESREPDPDRLYAQIWANSLLDEVRCRLQESYARRDRSKVLIALMPRLTESLAKSQYDQLAGELSLSPSAVKVAMHRLRQRFGQLLREVVLETLEDESEIDAEIGELRAAMASDPGNISLTDDTASHENAGI